MTVFAKYDPFFVGFDKLFSKIENFHSERNQPSYPPYNVIKLGEETYCIEIAVAGFSMENLEIVHCPNENLLTVTGKNEPSVGDYVHKGIAGRSFKRSWTVHENIQITGATLDKGLLQINLCHIIPDALKPKVISINSSDEAVQIQSK